MKLIAKTPEERYQDGVKRGRAIFVDVSASGKAHGSIAEFSLGEQDASRSSDDTLRSCMGGHAKIDMLLGAFDRVVADDGPGLVLVSGYSGIGKICVSSTKLHKALIPPRGLFASGKFDQYKRGHPIRDFGRSVSEPDPSPLE